MAATEQITLKSSDGQEFRVSERVARRSEIIKEKINELGANSVIILPDINGDMLSRVLDYCQSHQTRGIDFSDPFFNDLHIDMVFNITMAAGKLKVGDLLQLGYNVLSDRMIGRTPEELREMFHIEDNLSEEEKEQIRRRNLWAFL